MGQLSLASRGAWALLGVLVLACGTAATQPLGPPGSGPGPDRGRPPFPGMRGPGPGGGPPPIDRPFARARSVFRALDRNLDDRLAPGELPVPPALIERATGKPDGSVSWKEFTPFLITIYLKWCVFRSFGGTIDHPVDPREDPQLARLLGPRAPGRDGNAPVGWQEFLDVFNDRGVFPLTGFNLMLHFDPRDLDHDGVLAGEELAGFATPSGPEQVITLRQFIEALEGISPRGMPQMLDFDHDVDGDMRLDAKEAAAAGVDLSLEDSNRDGAFSVHDLVIPEKVVVAPVRVPPTPARTPASTPAPTASPSPASTPAPTASPSPASTPAPTASPSPAPSPTPSPSPPPTATPAPTPAPTPRLDLPAGAPPVSSFPLGSVLLGSLLGAGLLAVAFMRRGSGVTSGKMPSPPAEDADWNAAQAQYRQQRYDRAAALLQKVMRKEGPYLERARGLLIDTFLRMKLPEEAARMAAGYSSAELDIRHLYSIADGFDRAGCPREAIQFFRLVIDRDASYRDCASRLRKLSETASHPGTATAPLPVEVVTAATDGTIPGLDGRYSDAQQIGMGGMGCIYRVFDSMLDRHIAIKVMQAKMLEDPTARQRFIREVRALGQLSHPHIVPIYDVALDPVPRYSMPLLSGKDLSYLIQEDKLPAEHRLRIAIEIGEALAHAHANEILHRDIKPSNIFVTDEGKAFLLDFGLAQQEDTTSITRDGLLVGSLSYIAPELVAGSRPSRHTDIYSYGVMLHELFTGRKPAPGVGPWAAAESPAGELPPALEGIVRRSMSKEPAQRPASMEDVVRELRAVEAQQRGPAADDESRRILALACRIEGLYRMRIHTLKNMAGVIQRYRSQPESAAERFFRPENLERVLELVGDDLKQELDAITHSRGELRMEHLPDLARAIDGIDAVKDSLIKLPRTIEELRGQPVVTRVTVLEKWYRAFLALSDVLLKALGSLLVDVDRAIERSSRVVAGQLEIEKQLPADFRCRSSSPEQMAKDLETVLENLFQNAAQAGAKRLVIRGEHSTNHSHLVMTLTNDGPAMSEEVAARILREPVTTRPGGRGTGLPACKRILESHGGRVILVTRDPVAFQLALDRGFLELPREPAPAIRKEPS